MRITIVQGAFLPVPPLRGGAIEKAFHALAKEFDHAGHSVHYISRECDNLPKEETEGQNIQHLRIKGYDTPGSLIKLKWLDLLYSIRARRHLPDADILITHTFWMPILARNPRHGSLYIHVGRSPKGQMRLYKHAVRFQTVSSAIGDAIQNELPIKKKSNVKVLPYPLDSTFLTFSNTTVEKKNRILYAGRIHPEKGLELLLKGFAELAKPLRQQWELKIIGPWRKAEGGAGKKFLDSLKASAIGLNVHFQEPIFDQESLVREYDEASLFAYPSLAEQGETFGLAALEAMSRGCLTVVSNLQCFKDFVEDGVNAFCFEHRKANPEQDLSEKLVNLIQNHKKLQPVRQEAIRVAQAHSPKSISERFIEDFRSIHKLSP